MSVAKGRNHFEVYIDEKADLLERMIHEVPTIIHQEFENGEEYYRTIAHQNSSEDFEIYSSIYNSFSECLEGESEMIEDFYLSMAVMISRYCETTLKKIAVCDKIKKSNTSKIDLYYEMIATKYGIELLDIDSIWTNKKVFMTKRNEITHDGDIQVTKEELLINLEQVRHLLQCTIKAVPIKNTNQIIKTIGL